MRILLFAGLIWCFFSNAKPLRLVYPTFAPYTEAPKFNHQQAAGNFLVSKVMEKLDQAYTSENVPNYKRALSDVSHQIADGFFLASQNEERDAIAVFSQPLVYNNWSWFFRYDSYLDPYADNFKSRAKVASIHDTNTHYWLIHRSYKVIGKQRDTTKLAQLLFDLKRIDAVFISAEVFKSAANHPNVRQGEYIEVVQRSAPFGIYISKYWLAQHPGFMEKLNHAITEVNAEYLGNAYDLSTLQRD